MRQLVHIRPTFERANQIDEKGGPGPLFRYLAERFKPEAIYVSAVHREGWFVVDLDTPAKQREFTQIAINACGAEPNYLGPVMTGQEAAAIIPEAVQQARKAPGT